MEIYKSSQEMDKAFEDINGSKSRAAEKSQRTLEVNGEVSIGSVLNAYKDIQQEAGSKAPISMSPVVAKNRSNLPKFEKKAVSVSTHQLVNKQPDPNSSS